jgi:hypothetical protein
MLRERSNELILNVKNFVCAAAKNGENMRMLVYAEEIFVDNAAASAVKRI